MVRSIMFCEACEVQRKSYPNSQLTCSFRWMSPHEDCNPILIASVCLGLVGFHDLGIFLFKS